jgi:hypothetical protein
VGDAKAGLQFQQPADRLVRLLAPGAPGDANRAKNWLTKGIVGKRLTYRRPTPKDIPF